MPGTSRVKPKAQTRAEAQSVYDDVTARDVTCRAPFIDPDCDSCSGRSERHHAGLKMGMARVTARNRVCILCSHHNGGAWARIHDRAVMAWLSRFAP